VVEEKKNFGQKMNFKNYILEAYPENFSFEEFNNIKSYNGKLKYANERLKKLSSGSSRVVYQIDNEKVLKIAKNKKGLAQNESEADWSKEAYDVTAKVFETSDEYFWVEMELAKKLTPTRFKQLTGLSIPEMQTAMRVLRERMRPVRNLAPLKLTPEAEAKLYENEFYMDIERFVADYDMETGDMGRLNSYGEVIRDGQPKIVLVDFGVTNQVWNDYYKVS
jgi:mRNA-degrading endonuclease RelE of RelBE toxin-antitoxin system